MPSGGRFRNGITLVELLVVVALIALVIALVLPAVQAARQAAWRAQCANNLKQVGLAVQQHVGVKGTLPSLYNGTSLAQPQTGLDLFNFHSWRTPLLPYLEAGPLANTLNLTLPSTAPANQTSVRVGLAVLVCPATSDPTATVPIYCFTGSLPIGWPLPAGQQQQATAARADYEAVGGVQVGGNRGQPGPILQGVEFGAWGEPTFVGNTFVVLGVRPARLADITDGLSQTILVAERAGRPDEYQRGQPLIPWMHNSGTSMDNHQAAWAISTHYPWIVLPPTQTFGVNFSNRGIYSFHPGGAHAALGDGSVRFLRDALNPTILQALSTRSGAEPISDDP